MDIHKESERGHAAKQLLDNEIYREAIASLRESIVTKRRNAPIRDREGAHELKLMDKLLTDIEGYIKTVADTGKMADIQLEKEKNIAKLKIAGIRA